MRIPRPLPLLLTSALVASAFVRERLHGQALETELLTLRGSCSPAPPNGRNKGFRSTGEGDPEVNATERARLFPPEGAVSDRIVSEVGNSSDVLVTGEAAEPPPPEQLAAAREYADRTVAKMDKALGLTPQAREQLHQHHMQTYLGTFEPRINEEGETIDEVEAVLGKEAYEKWNQSVEAENTAAARVASDKRVFAISREMGMSTQDEDKLRDALTKSDDSVVQEVAYLTRTLNLDPVAEGKIRDVFETIDSEVAEQFAQELPDDQNANGALSQNTETGSIPKGLEPANMEILKTKILDQKLASFLSESQLKKYHEYLESQLP